MEDKQTALSTLFEDKILLFLKENGLDVQDLRTTVKGKAKQNQPDIFCKQLGYLEPTVARCDKDGFSKLEYDAPIWNTNNAESPAFGCVPQELIEKQQSLLASRIVNRLQEKEKNIKRYYSKKTIKDDEPCFVCLTIDTNGFSRDYFDEYFIEDTLTRIFYQINTNELEISKDGSWYKIITTPFNKPNLTAKNVPIETGVFTKDNTFENIAGVIFVIPKPIRVSNSANFIYDCLHDENITYTNKDIFFFWNLNAKIFLGEERVKIIKKLKFKKNYC